MSMANIKHLSVFTYLQERNDPFKKFWTRKEQLSIVIRA